MPDTPGGMITQVLKAVGAGDQRASAELLPLVYNELRSLARARMANTPPGNTLQPTALVHEAYLRLVGDEDPSWNSRGHFFAAAAESMRQILVDQARRKASLKRGGDRDRVPADYVDLAIEPPDGNLLALDEALRKLERDDPDKGRIVMLRYFAGLTREETAEVLGTSVRTLDRQWRYIIAKLHKDIADVEKTSDDQATE